MEEEKIRKALDLILRRDFDHRIPNKILNESNMLNYSFRIDLDMDSLDTYEFIYHVEEELGVAIPDEKINNFEIPEDCVQYLLNIEN